MGIYIRTDNDKFFVTDPGELKSDFENDYWKIYRENELVLLVPKNSVRFILTNISYEYFQSTLNIDLKRSCVII